MNHALPRVRLVSVHGFEQQGPGSVSVEIEEVYGGGRRGHHLQRCLWRWWLVQLPALVLFHFNGVVAHFVFFFHVALVNGVLFVLAPVPKQLRAVEKHLNGNGGDSLHRYHDVMICQARREAPWRNISKSTKYCYYYYYYYYLDHTIRKEKHDSCQQSTKVLLYKHLDVESFCAQIILVVNRKRLTEALFGWAGHLI